MAAYQRTAKEVAADGRRVVTRGLTKGEIAALERHAKADDRTVSYLVAKIVREWLEKEAQR